MNLEKIKEAVREYNAASNSLRRAIKELAALIPEGDVVLHKRPGEETKLYWSYTGYAEPGAGDTFMDGFSTIEGSSALRRNCVIIEAPGKEEEFLPRLPHNPGERP